MTTQKILTIQNLTKKFKNGAGVNQVSFAIDKGKIVGFIGDNGAGKTTTIKLIFGEYKKDSGDVLVDGIAHEKKEALQKISFFPDQNSYPKHYKIKKYAYYSASLKGIDKKEVDKIYFELLKALNLEEFAKSKFDELSAGMQKRALLLATLVTDPELIILDEPTSNLDVKSRIEFLEVLKFLAEKRNTTIVITSHNIDELSSLINEVIIIKDGEIQYQNAFDPAKENLRNVYNEHVDSEKSSIQYKRIEDIFREKEGENNA
ncbi:ABC transporter ATP-binding protein [Williamsoniiplasma luminosum]|uniref:ABC transporter ATP-binding protein n=1 Tax=Williamsoniiplasma luminosum TaxID=214888 RepID=A0A2K8NT69_9MOLU|nr:ABC transporter ATP-binding protein [Williamsoniiplasma luminosum]ATZ16954.1 ABC transporter ATP-binding protein [Williamsoniiplasma luminosum]